MDIRHKEKFEWQIISIGGIMGPRWFHYGQLNSLAEMSWLHSLTVRCILVKQDLSEAQP